MARQTPTGAAPFGMPEAADVPRGGGRAANPALPRILPFAVFIVLLGVEPFVATMLEGNLDPRWLYAFRSVVTALLLLVLWRNYTELKDAPRVSARIWVLGVAIGLFVFAFWIVLDIPPLILGEGDGYDPSVDGAIHLGLAATRLLGSALVVPLMEELFWRSFLMRWLQRPRFLDVDPAEVGWKALLISSAIFAVEHRLWFAGLLAGLIYGELYRRSRNVWVVIVAHAVTNGALGVYVLVRGAWGFW